MNQLQRKSLVGFLLLVSLSGRAQTFDGCGSIENAYGPFDYTDPVHFTEMLPRVEAYHFSAEIENLNGTNVAGDIDYTLRAFPNHHRALYSMSRYYLEQVPRGERKMQYTAECYFNRARRFAPTDPAVVALEGIYLMRLGKSNDAKDRLEAALAMAPNSAEIQYNAGLVYAELEDFPKAVEHAQRAYALGYPLPGLRNRLRKAGVWKDGRPEEQSN